MSQNSTVVLINFSTHTVFGIIVGALLFGRPQIALMIGIGSAINDLDRKYGFFSKDPLNADKYNFLYNQLGFEPSFKWEISSNHLYEKAQ